MTTTSMTAQPKHVLTLDRVLDAPVEKVWRCWAQPKLLEQWFCPKPWFVTDVVMDFRPGGEMTCVFNGPDGETFPNGGVYLAIEPKARIVSTDAFRAGWVPSARAFTVMETMMREAGAGRTDFTWRALHWSAEAMAEHEAMGFHDGWGAAADQLEALARTV